MKLQIDKEKLKKNAKVAGLAVARTGVKAAKATGKIIAEKGPVVAEAAGNGISKAVDAIRERKKETVKVSDIKVDVPDEPAQTGARKTLVPATCEKCGAALEVDPSQETAFCSYCGTKFIVSQAIESYNIRNAEIHADTVEIHKKGTVEAALDYAGDRRKDNLDRKEREKRERREKSAKFWKAVLRIFLIVAVIEIIGGIGLYLYNSEKEKAEERTLQTILSEAQAALSANDPETAEIRANSLYSSSKHRAVREKWDGIRESLLNLIEAKKADLAATSETEQQTQIENSAPLERDELPEKTALVVPENSELIAYFLDVGQGDATVITCDSRAMVVDGGGSEQSDYIYSFLKNHNIETVDYVVATHPGTDHIGGLSAVFHCASVQNVLCNYTDYDTETFNTFKRTIEEQALQIRVPTVGEVFYLGSAEVTVLGPYYQENNSSIVLRIVHGENSFLLTGDAESNEEQALLNSGCVVQSNVLKVGHHGSDTSTTQAFLDAVSPEYAVISAGGSNQYGHPTETVLSRIKASGANLCRTDMHGMVTMTSDGAMLTVQEEKHPDTDPFSAAGGYDNMLAAQRTLEEQQIAEQSRQVKLDTWTTSIDYIEPTESVQSAEPEASYIVNTNTGKFHYPGCSSVKKMNESNKWYYTGTRSNLISQGYSPCGKCNP